MLKELILTTNPSAPFERDLPAPTLLLMIYDVFLPSVMGGVPGMPYATATTTPMPSLTPTPTSTPTATPLPPEGMVLISAGPFQMGCDTGNPAEIECPDDELPLHSVELDAYFIGKYEVTNAQYASCVAAGACTPPQDAASLLRPSYYDNPDFSDFPILKTNWRQAAAYCAWAGGRLPTEAEGEKAARGTDGRIYPWGNMPLDATLLNSDGTVGDTTRVGSYPAGASPYGVMDMAGNMWEWLSDWYSPTYYSDSPAANPTGPVSGRNRVVRGGSWDPNAGTLRSAGREDVFPDLGNNIHGGFRCVRSY